MTYEEVKAIRQNPTVEPIDNEELSDMIDKAIDMAIALEKTYMDIKPLLKLKEFLIAWREIEPFEEVE